MRITGWNTVKKLLIYENVNKFSAVVLIIINVLTLMQINDIILIIAIKSYVFACIPSIFYNLSSKHMICTFFIIGDTNSG